MQLHVCLLLFIITTDKSLASSLQLCGGNVSLDSEPDVGHITITLPSFTATGPINQTQSVCTWEVDVPVGRTVLLKALWLESGSNISVSCVRNQENQDQVFESGEEAQLSGCDRNKATLTWTGYGRSLNGTLQLSYYVQEDERNSSEDHTSPHSDPTQTGTSFTSTAPVSEKTVRGLGGVRGRLCEGLGPSCQDQGLLLPTSPMQGHAEAATTDRETLPFPEEEANNGAETSGAAHLTGAPISATESARTRPTLRTDASKSETNTDELSQTQMALMVDSSSSFHSTDTNKHATSRMFKHKDEFTTTQAHSAVSTWESGTILIAQGGAVSGMTADKQLHSSRSQRSTVKLNPDPTSAVTSDPLKPTTESPQVDPSSAQTDTKSPEPSASSQVPVRTAVTERDSAVSTAASLSSQPNTAQADLFHSALVSIQTAASKSLDKSDNTTERQSHISVSTQTQTNSESVTLSPYMSVTFTQTQTTMESTQKNVFNTHMTDVTSTIPSSSDSTSAFTGSSPTFGDVHNSPAVETATETNTLRHENLLTNSPSLVPLLLSSTSQSSTLDMLETHNIVSVSSHTPVSLTSSVTTRITAPPPSLAPTAGSTTSSHNFITTHASLLPLTTTQSDDGHEDEDVEAETDDESLHKFLSSTVTHSPTAGRPERPPPQTTPRSRQESLMTSPPKFYIVPDQPAAVRVELIELLVQLIVEESRSPFTPGLEEDAAAWMEPYLRRAPGFSRLLGVWSSGHVLQSLVEFKTSEALQWLSNSGPMSLLERTGLAQAVSDGTSFRSSKITNITLGGLQGDVCDWLLQCPSGYKCAFHPQTTNYTCSSVCRFDFCHHHGICTHHPGQHPVCRCLVGDDFWYMGQRCDVRMTRGRLVGACLAILLIMVTVIGISALVAVRRYRAALIQAKVDQTRSSYRRFNHFDELSGRFWLRSWAGSADSLDNPGFTRSDELLHLRALDRPCCYHDDTLSLASTCPSHGARINTIYPHSSQYGWRGSEVSVGDGVLDSGKASDLSVCSWPVEPIQWTPFPLLQQLASHRTNTVRVTRPRSYCEGMELVDMGKSWTA